MKNELNQKFSRRSGDGRPRWMVVDDDRILLRVTARLLSLMGDAEIVCCESPLEAVGILKSNSARENHFPGHALEPVCALA